MTLETTRILGDVDISEIGSLLSDRARCRVLMALNDGRALSAGVLADEAGVARSTASGHLGKLTEAGLLQVETRGRNRYYRLAGDQVGELLEQLTRMAPAHPVHSLREGSRAQQLRSARTCYDHLAGRLGVWVMAALIERGYLKGGDGRREPGDRLAGYGRDAQYALTTTGWDFLTRLGVQIPESNRTLVRYCVDWSEQRHHVAGLLGRSLLQKFLTETWIRRRETGRSVQVTEAGAAALHGEFGIVWS